MSRRLLSHLRARRQDERGAVLVIFALLLLVVFGLAALLVDGGQARTSRREAQSISDLAALAGGKSLSLGSPAQACLDAVDYLNSNARDLSPKITVSSFCTQASNNVGLTNCSVVGGPTQAKPTATVGRYTVTVIYPVLASDIADAHFTSGGGAGLNDGTPCQRMGVKVTVDNPTFFGSILGTNSIQTSRLAVVKARDSVVKNVPSLWLLDPFDCTSLAASGGSKVTVGDLTTSPPIAGLITIDSDGTDCSGGQTSISATGGGTQITAAPTTGSDKGQISLYAQSAGSLTCSADACDQSDVTAGRLGPQPVASDERATRAPVDWKYNCKSSYPAYHGISLAGCPDTATSYPYIDNLVTALGTTGLPSGYQRWTTAGYSCSPTGTITVSGNWWVDCSGGPGFTVGNGTTVNFNGNVVFQRDVGISGTGQLNVNGGNATATLPSACTAPGLSTPCPTTSAATAAIVYMRGGNLTSTGAMNFQHVAMIQNGGYFKNSGGSAPIWTAPTEGPLKALALWSDFASSQYQINGGAAMQLDGVFFTPEATPFSISGGSPVAQQKAQFISRQLAISGGGNLIMAPDEANHISIPPKSGSLIR